MSKISLSEKYCINCGVKGVVERKRCKECARLYNNNRAKERYKRIGKYNYGKGICPVCNEEMTIWKRGQVHHAKCLSFSKFTKNDPEAQRGRYQARKIISSLGVNIPKGYEIHHLDENPLNNETSNLCLISRSAHKSLHRFLHEHRSLFLKENKSTSENCWNLLRDHLTTAWIEKSGANVIKISDIGKSAAEPLLNEEGSETMHG